MQVVKKLEFVSQNYGRCIFQLAENIENCQELVEDYHGSTSLIQEALNRLNTWRHINDCTQALIYKLTAETDFKQLLGFVGLFTRTNELEQCYLEVCYYLLPTTPQYDLEERLITTLIDQAFDIENSASIRVANPIGDQSLKILERLGFEESTKSVDLPCYDLTKTNRGLFLLSQIIEKESTNLIPRVHDLTKINMERTRTLWYTYFDKGVSLSNGGVEHSFISSKSLFQSPRLTNFNMYRSDREESVLLKPDEMERFLIEENAISTTIDRRDISFAFSLGSHEGFMRVARCIYASKKNDGIFHPVGSYGFMAAGVATMKPMPYSIYLVGINRKNGEKILLNDLALLIQQHPTARTLFLELKTTAGAIYTSAELSEVIEFCKENQLILIVDAAHLNMEFSEKNRFPDVVKLCQAAGYNDFVVLYTCSKTYGFERARVGIIVLSKKHKTHDLYQKIERDSYAVLGSGSDVSYEAARLLFNSSAKERRAYIDRCTKKHHHNMNLMLAYIEGISSRNIAPELYEQLKAKIVFPYTNGINGLSLVHKPEGAIQMKISMAGLKDKWFTNIRMFNSEIFCYALNKLAGVVTLNSFQILDPEGFGMRFSFSIEEDVHKGMKAIFGFVNQLSDTPSLNKFLPQVTSIEDIIFPNSQQVLENIKQSRLTASSLKSEKNDSLLTAYKENVTKKIPKYLFFTNKQIEQCVSNAASSIQHAWRRYNKLKIANESSPQLQAFKSKL